jgi:PKD repeat protein
VYSSYSQCPTVAVSAPTTACVNIPYSATNTSTGAVETEWRYCSGSLGRATPVVNKLGSLGTAGLVGGVNYDLSIYREGNNWYGFTVTRSSGATTRRITRLDFGTSLTNTPVATNLGSFAGILTTPNNVVAVEEAGVKYLLVSNRTATNGGVVRFTLGTSYANVPTNPTVFTDPLLASINDLEVVQNAVFAPCASRLVQIVFGNGFGSDPTSIVNLAGTFGGSATPTYNSIEIVRDCGQWVAFMSLGNSILRNTIGTSITSPTPGTVVTLNTGANEARTPGKLQVVRDSTNWYLAFTNNNSAPPNMGNMLLYNLGTGLTATNSPTKLYGAPNETTPSTSIVRGSACLVNQNSNWYFFSVNRTENDLTRLDFNSTCGSPNTYGPNPGTTYTQAGTFGLQGNFTAADGSLAFFHENVTAVSGPPITIIGPTTGCIGQGVTFSYSGPGTPSWEFGDGATATGASTIKTFATAGTFSVRLQVNYPSGCPSVAVQNIIVGVVPSAGFAFSGNCQGQPYGFTDQSTISAGSITNWNWNFGDGNTSTQQNPTHIFSTGGAKNVTLTVTSTNGCVSSTTISVPVQNNPLAPGPLAQFPVPAACRNEAVTFSTQGSIGVVPGTIVSWTFGGGAQPASSTQTNPTVVFPTAGDFAVSLNLTSANGCVNQKDTTIRVQPEPVADFTMSGQSCLGSTFTFTDASTVQNTFGNTIANRSWLITPGGITSSDATFAFTPTLPGNYQIRLIVQASGGCRDTIVKSIAVSGAAFTAPDTVCLTASIPLTNLSGEPANAYTWDFCPGDFGTGTANGPDGQIIRLSGFSGELNTSRGITMVKHNGEWYGFAAAFTGNTLYRINFGANLANTSPTLTSLGNPGNLLNGPNAIAHVVDNGTFILLIANDGGNNLTRLVYPSPTSTVPTSAVSFPGLTTPNAIEPVFDGTTWYVYLTDRDQFGPGGGVGRYNFGSSLLNTPGNAQTITFPTNPTGLITRPVGIEIQRACDGWYMFVANVAGGGTGRNIARFFFGPTLGTAAVSGNFLAQNSVNDFGTPSSLQLVRETNGWYLFTLVQSAAGHSYYQIELGPDLNNPAPVSTNWGLTGSANIINGSVHVLDSSVHRFYGMRSAGNTNLTGLTAWQYKSGPCVAIVKQSEQFQPVDGAYDDIGTQTIGLYNQSADGSIGVATRNIFVRNGPRARFTIPTTGCVGQSIQTVNTSTGSPIYSWNFGEPGTPGNITSTTNPSFIYTTPGVKTISLTVGNGANGSCAPTASKIIRISDRPVADFSFTSQCSGFPTAFTDQSTFTQDSIVSWFWDFGPNLTSTQRNPTITFQNAGSYTVKLRVANAYGCADSILKTIAIEVRPTAVFNVTNTCAGSTTTFNNQSLITGNSFQWNFGDPASGAANTSTLYSPTHVFSAAGSYTVRLIAVGPTGCRDTSTQVVEVRPGVTPSFTTNGVVCQSGLVTFTNTTPVLPTDVLSYEWNFGNGETANTANGTTIFTTPGTYPVTLRLTQKTSCITTVQQNVTVLQGPTPSFTNTPICLGQSVTFTNTSTYPSGQTRVSAEWLIDGTIIPAISPTYTFNNPGNVVVELRETSSNGCVSITQKTVTVPIKPIADFEALSGACAGTVLPLSDLSVGGSIPINGWFWDFGPLGTVGIQKPQVVYPGPGVYTIKLVVKNANGCVSDTVVKQVSVGATSFMSSADTVCVDQTITLTNNTLGAVSQTWDFCTGDFDNTPTATILGQYTNALAQGYTLNMVREGTTFLGFTGNSQLDSVYIFNFGASTQNTPTVSTLNVDRVLTNGARAVAFAEQNGQKFAFVAGLQMTGLLKVDFGTSYLNNPPVGTTTHALGTTSTNGWDVDVVRENNQWHVFLLSVTTAQSRLYRFDFGVDLNNNPLKIDSLTMPTGTSSVTLVKDCSGWYVFAFSTSTAAGVPAMTRLSLGGSIENTTTTPVTYTFSSAAVRLSQAYVLNEGGNWYILAQSETAGNFLRILIGPNLNAPTLTVTNFGTVGLAGQANRTALGYIRDGSSHTFYGASRTTRNLFRYSFADNCDASIATSTDQQPPFISYSSSGRKVIALESIVSGGQPSYASRPVVIALLPSLNFSVQNTCVGQPTTFTNTSTLNVPPTSTITLRNFTWRWLFGEGGASSDSLNAAHVYSSPGTYTVRLIVSSSNGCTDTLSRTITVGFTPKADFVFTTGICQASPITFTDGSTLTGDSICVRRWIMGNGEVRVQPGLTFQHFYPVGGSYRVQLITTSCSGCSDTVTKTVVVPELRMDIANSCFGDTTRFTASAIYPANPTFNFSWQFGDGTSATGRVASHIYSQAGTYTVTLAVATGNGCQDTLRRVLTVGTRPTVDFAVVGGTCSGQSVQFEDLSTTTDITQPLVGWHWTFGDPASGSADTSIFRNPTHEYTGIGSFTVTLRARTVTGCEVVRTKVINIGPKPQLGFDLRAGQCQSVPFSPRDTSVAAPGDSIVRRMWLYTERGKLFFTNLNEPVFVFDNPGTYPISLVVYTRNGCVDTLTRIVTVAPPTRAAFTPSTLEAVAPATVSFTQQTVRGRYYSWSFGDTANVVDTAAAPTYVYTQPGDYTIRLITTFDSVCFDTTFRTIRILAPFDTLLDITVEDLSVAYDSVFVRPKVVLRNNGTVPISRVTLVARMGVNTQLREIWDIGQSLMPGDAFEYAFEGELFNNPFDSLQYLCVEAIRPNNDADDRPADNSRCKTLIQKLALVNLYPNPFRESLTVSLSAPRSGTILLEVFDHRGRNVLNEQRWDVTAGFNSRSFVTETWSAARYVIRLRYENEIIDRTIQKW